MRKKIRDREREREREREKKRDYRDRIKKSGKNRSV